jgi:hypothetical protein
LLSHDIVNRYANVMMAEKYRMAVITVITMLSECRIESICSIEF